MTEDVSTGSTGERPPRPLSQVLGTLAAPAGDRVSLGTIAAALSDRSYGALLTLFSAPNLLPLPPGASTVFGVPLVLVAAQLLVGQQEIWLPRALRERTVARDTFERIAVRLEPILRRLERLARPRYWPMPSNVVDRLVGALALLMALVLILPIPLGNWMPALSIVLTSIGMTERDGLWLAAGAAAVASVGITAGVLGALGSTAGALLG